MAFPGRDLARLRLLTLGVVPVDPTEPQPLVRDGEDGDEDERRHDEVAGPTRPASALVRPVAAPHERREEDQHGSRGHHEQRDRREVVREERRRVGARPALASPGRAPCSRGDPPRCRRALSSPPMPPTVRQHQPRPHSNTAKACSLGKGGWTSRARGRHVCRMGHYRAATRVERDEVVHGRLHVRIAKRPDAVLEAREDPELLLASSTRVVERAGISDEGLVLLCRDEQGRH